MASHPIKSWDRLTVVATLGTRRTPLPQEGLWPDGGLAAAQTQAPETTLLRAAIASWLHERAGSRRASDTPMQSHTYPDLSSLLVVSEAAAWRLGRMLNGEQPELVREWFTLAAQAQRTIPPHWLPLVLEQVPARERASFGAVLGPAATWLCAHNPEWTVTPIVQEPSLARWLEGTFEQRCAELSALRARTPDVAVSWLEQTWSSDQSDAREAFVGLLSAGVSAADEAFLERALEDKRKGVRLAAAMCLARLSTSALVQRMQNRLEPLVQMEEARSGLLSRFRKRKLEIVLPTELDKAAVRDGVEAKPRPNRQIGERAFWLMQMIAVVPPRHWSERFSCDAVTFVQAAATTEYGPDLLDAFTQALARHPDPEWIDAIWNQWLEAQDPAGALYDPLAGLLRSLPVDQRIPVLTAKLAPLHTRDRGLLLHMFRVLDVPWTAAFTREALKYVQQIVRADTQQYSHARHVLDRPAQMCDVDTATQLLPEIAAACAENSPWRNALEQMNDIVEFRAAMKRELLT